MVKNYIKLMRPKHYLKNILIFLPLVFSGGIFEYKMILSCLLGFISFSLAASVVYIINDIHDLEKDKLHEKKKNRPIASGKIPVSSAIIFAIFLLLISILTFYLISYYNLSNLNGYIFILIYIIINVFYSFGLKDIPIIDIVILVFGFLLRIIYGATIIDVEVSNWLYLTVMSGSFYLALGKRRNEIIKSGSETRKVLKHYNSSFLDKNMYMILSLTIVFYSLWCVDPLIQSKTYNLLIWTVPLVIVIFMRYSMIIEGDSHGDPVDVIFSDKTLLFLGILYSLIMFLILYLPVIVLQ